MSNFFDKDGKPLELYEWAKQMEDFNYRRIKYEILPNGYIVSTVWLGLDHSHSEIMKLIFETRVFEKKGSWSNLDRERYSNLEEAENGHKEMVNKWSKKVK